MESARPPNRGEVALEIFSEGSSANPERVQTVSSKNSSVAQNGVLL